MTTDTYTYLQRAEIDNVHQTIADLIGKLYEAETKTNDKGYNQVVLQLNPSGDGKQWKMFVYYSKERETFYYSFQDEDYYDTDLTYGKDQTEIVAQMEQEIDEAGGFEWIELDLDD